MRQATSKFELFRSEVCTPGTGDLCQVAFTRVFQVTTKAFTAVAHDSENKAIGRLYNAYVSINCFKDYYFSPGRVEMGKT